MKISIRTKLVTLILGVLLLSTGLIAYQGLMFFQRDKTTYVFDLITQAVTSQSKELEQRLSAMTKMMEIFSEVSDASLSLAERDSLLRKYEDFLYIGTFSKQGETLADRVVIADRNRLQQMGINPSEVKNDGRILKLIQQPQRFAALNFTMQSSGPAVAVVLQPSDSRIVIGVFAQETLLDIAARKKIYNAYVVDRAGNVVMHYDGEELLKRRNLSDAPLVTAWLRNPQLPMTSEYKLEDATTILGAYSEIRSFPLGIFAEVPKEQAFLAARRLIKALSILAVSVLIGSCLLGVLFAYNLTRPLKQLAQLTARIARGEFTAQTDIRANDEIGDLATSFNRMSHELEARDKKLEESNKQLVQSEKMSAFGQMSAGIAHEVKNPLAGILGYAQLAKRKLSEDNPIIKYVDIIEKETKRCKEIIENLMKFARQEKTAFEPFDVNQTVNESIMLVDHQITLHGVKIVRELAPDAAMPKVNGSANQMQQVLMNLMLNAQHAMENGGTLTIRTRAEGKSKAIIQVSDTGHGIKPENLKKIFEPFFTTKPAGKGTGLGLAVTYGIIKEHKGDVNVDSVVGKGTTFTVTLPGC